MPSRLQQEIKQTRPFRSPAQEATVGLVRTADALRRYMGGRLEAAGLTVQQYNVLRILRGAGPEGLPTLEIAERMIEQTPGITRLVDRLESKGLVSRERCPSDRRQVTCRITRGGLALLTKLDPVIDAADELIGREVGDTELKHLIRVMDALRTVLAEE
jgi:DNA-binding MarR family transcriptional regulator